MASVIDLPAGARARGRAHGEALREQVRGHFETWLANLDGGKAAAPRAYLADFLARSDFRPAARRWTPDLLEEVEGLAEGSGLAPEDAWALQLLDEEWAFSERRALEARAKCSTLAVPGGEGRPTLIGQTMDVGTYTDGFQTILRLAPDEDGPGALIFTLAGVVGLMGVGAAGVGVCVNSLPQLANAPSGLPVAFLLRGALARRSAAEAAAFLTAAPHATGQHYAVADAAEVISLEGSSVGVTPFAPGGDGRVLHTNHPLAAGAAPASWPNSRARLGSLTGRLSTGAVDAEAARAALSSFDDPDHPVCRLKSDTPGLINFTTGAMLAQLSPAGVVADFSFGPPSETTWRRFELAPA